MAKSASQRRFTKLVYELIHLWLNHPQRFQLVWCTYFRGWVQEVQRGAAAQRRSGAAAQRQDATDEPIPAIFGILEWAGTLRAESALKHSQPSRRA